MGAVLGAPTNMGWRRSVHGGATQTDQNGHEMCPLWVDRWSWPNNQMQGLVTI